MDEGLQALLQRRELGQFAANLVEVSLREVTASPDGGLIADYRGPVGDPEELAARFAADPGVAAHGLFGPALVSELFVGRGEDVERSSFGG